MKKRIYLTDMRHPAAAAIASCMAAQGWAVAENPTDLDALVICPYTISREMLSGNMNCVIENARENINAAFVAAREHGLPMAKAGRGNVVFLSSMHANKPTGAVPGYAIAQGALKMMMKELALFFGHYGLRVNMIAAAPLGSEQDDFDSDIVTVNYFSPEKNPIGRAITADDVASAVAMLLYQESGGINGAEIPVNGGLDLYYFEREYATL